VIWTLLLLAPAQAVSAQSLGEVAKKERKRREDNQREGVKARVITEDEVTRVSPGDPATAVEKDAILEPAAEDAPGLSKQTAPAPDFTLLDRAGRSFSLRDFRGRPLLVDFWATWCGPCKATMPEIERLHRKYGPRLEVVGINIEGNSPEVLAYLDERRYSFRVLFDEGNFLSGTARRYGVASIPRTFLIDRDGRILFAGHPQALPEGQIEAAIAP
jgi:thiol-disulfide isomerase/thioredoxin